MNQMTGAYLNLNDEFKSKLNQPEFPNMMYSLKTKLMENKSIRNIAVEDLLNIMLFTDRKLYADLLKTVHKIENKIQKP